MWGVWQVVLAAIFCEKYKKKDLYNKKECFASKSSHWIFSVCLSCVGFFHSFLLVSGPALVLILFVALRALKNFKRLQRQIITRQKARQKANCYNHCHSQLFYYWEFCSLASMLWLVNYFQVWEVIQEKKKKQLLSNTIWQLCWKYGVSTVP